MRTTLDLEEDLLMVAKQMAAQKQISMGRVVSQLMGQALQQANVREVRNGIPVFRSRSGAAKPSLELINRLRDEM